MGFLFGRRNITLWQILFLVLGTSWLWAPHLNTGLSPRTSLISQYETSFEPYSLLFRSGDFLAGLFLLAASFRLPKTGRDKFFGWLILMISLGLIIDPLFNTTCRLSGNTCIEYVSFNFVLHAIETCVTAGGIFILAVLDSVRRKRLVSIAFVLFQIAYGLLFISQLANQDRFNTFSQFIYQTTILIWLAWFIRDWLVKANFFTGAREQALVKNVVAAWAFLNGLLAIVVSLAHIHLAGKIAGLYFAGSNAWLAQHGVIIGVVMLYISRHLARGETRARQIFLLISGIEVLKYSVITPDPALMLLYMVTFLALFVLRDDFDRGSEPLTWRSRLHELYFMGGALLAAAAVALITLDRDGRIAAVTGHAFSHLTDFIERTGHQPTHLRSVLLADTISAFLVASLGAILWILFRPARLGVRGQDYAAVKEGLVKYSHSTEDYFKLWPKDKSFFWHDQTFIAYKQSGPVVFGLADPIGPDKENAISAFIDWARSHSLRVCFLPVYETSQAMYKKAGLELMQIGSSAVIDTRKFVSQTANDKWWRWKRNRAEKNFYRFIEALPPHDSHFLNRLAKVSDAWLKREGRAERTFALGYFDPAYLAECKISCLVTDNGEVIAFANELPQFNPGNTTTIDLMRHLPEHTEAMPYLLYKMIEACSSKTPHFDLGFVPFAKARGPLLSIAKTLSGSRFSATGLEQFKNKFDPDWQPNYMAYDGDLGDLTIIALHIEKVMDLD